MPDEDFSKYVAFAISRLCKIKQKSLEQEQIGVEILLEYYFW